MANHIRHLIVAAGLSLFAFVMQAGAAESSTKERMVSLSFSVSSREPISGLCFKSKKVTDPTKVIFYSGYRGDDYQYQGGEKLAFYADDVATVAEAAPVAVCTIPEGMSRALLMFFPRANPGADGIRYDVIPVDEALERMAPGTFAVINLTGKQYAATYGEGTPFMIEQGVNRAQSVTKGRSILRLAMQSGDGWRKAGRRTLDLSENNRVWVILYPPTLSTDVYPIIQTLTQATPKLPATTHGALAVTP